MVTGLSPIAAGAHLIVDVGVSLRAPAFAVRSSVITYKIDVSDLAYDSAYGVVVSDQLGSGMHFTSANGDGWNCSASGGTVNCSAESIGPGVSTITVVASAPSSTRIVRTTTLPHRHTSTTPRSVAAPPRLCFRQQNRPRLPMVLQRCRGPPFPEHSLIESGSAWKEHYLP
jgi:uncharacterized repeat protein (TIGR01451 family)